MHRSRSARATAVAALALLSVAADFSEVSPTVFPKDDPRTKAFTEMMGADVRRRMREANVRESKAFAAVTTKAEWEVYRNARLLKLRASLGTFPAVPETMRIEVTREIEGDGYTLRNLLYETRPGFWVTANLYSPVKAPEKMPGVLISHSHHNGKTNGELQDMGMTWARSGAAVLIPDHPGYGERRQHGFQTAKDYGKPFRVGRQDYYFRYDSNLQLSSVGEGLMGWMVWDLMRGVDVLLKRPGIDKERIVLMGSVAGGGDPVGVTAALDDRIACAVPFNFGGVQPESSALENPDADFAWFGDGYWESTRGLRDGVPHFAIVGSLAPRKLIYAHEFAWKSESDPAFPRLQKIFGFYKAEDSPKVAHGSGSLKGRPPESSHCDHIGAVHRNMIYPALKEWFGMPVPTEYSKRLPATDLTCWTEEARKRLEPKPLHRVIADFAESARSAPAVEVAHLQRAWEKRLGIVAPSETPKVSEGEAEDVTGAKLTRFALETDPGIAVPVFVLTPAADKVPKGKRPAVVMVASAGKRGFLKERGAEISSLLDAGVVVCLADVRGTGESRPGASPDRGSSRTSISQSNLMLGQPVLGSQLRDLRTVIRWLRTREGIDGKRVGVWGDSFAEANAPDTVLAVPHDADRPAISEPGGANLALLAGLFEEVAAVYAGGGLAPGGSVTDSPYLYLPHDAIVPAPLPIADSILPALTRSRFPILYADPVDAQNRRIGKPVGGGAEWMIGKLGGR